MNKQTLKWIIYAGLFMIPFVPILVSSSFFFPFITSKAFTFRIIVEIIFAAWILLALLDPAYRLRRSLIVYSLLAFLLIIGLADIFGVAPLKSFWSNYERMEGYITLLHLGAFFVVISSVFSATRVGAAPAKSGGQGSASPKGGRDKMWERWWNTSLVASFVIVIYSFFQLAGTLAINQGGVRVDATFGNASYLAVYLLVHIFLAIIFLYRSRKNTALAWVYGILILLQTTILYHTATRGAILGLLGGLVIVAILNLRNKSDVRVRKLSGIGLGLVLILAGTFLMFKNSGFVTESPVLSRFASISTEELQGGGRSFVWPMAIEGVKERPILGWGQDNFNYVFNEHYDPAMYQLEPWFDRAHNIFLDWAVAGGLLGLLAYLSLYTSFLAVLWRRATSLTYLEKSLFTGLLSAYFFHNLFVFDHLVSYILFFALLANMHYFDSEGGSAQDGSGHRESKSHSTALALPMVFIVLGAVLYVVNIRPISANTSLIKALNYQQFNPPQHTLTIESFKKAYETSRLGQAEVGEQMVRIFPTILQSDLMAEDKNDFFRYVRDVVVEQASIVSGDTRRELLVGSFLYTLGQHEDALPYLKRAQELSPGKQQVYYELGASYLNNNKPALALEEFRKAYELAPESEESVIMYLLGAIYTGERSLEARLLGEISDSALVFDSRIMSAYYSVGRTVETRGILEKRIELDPANTATYQQLLEQL